MTASSDFEVSKFTIDIPDEQLDDLLDLLRRTRFPQDFANDDWRYGYNGDYARELTFFTNEVGFTTQQVQLVLMTAITCAALGAFAWGPVVDRIGPKRTLDLVLVLWMIVFVWAAAVGLFKLPPSTFWLVPPLAQPTKPGACVLVCACVCVCACSVCVQ